MWNYAQRPAIFISYLIMWWIAINAYRAIQIPCRTGLIYNHSVQSMLTETMKREEIIKARRMYSLGVRPRNTTSRPCGAISEWVVDGTERKLKKPTYFPVPSFINQSTLSWKCLCFFLPRFPRNSAFTAVTQFSQRCVLMRGDADGTSIRRPAS